MRNLCGRLHAFEQAHSRRIEVCRGARMACYNVKKAMRSVGFFAVTGTEIAKNRFGQRRGTRNSMRGIFARKLILAQEFPVMNPEFYLILDSDELTDEFADRVYEAGFDDSSFTMRGGKA